MYKDQSREETTTRLQEVKHHKWLTSGDQTESYVDDADNQNDTKHFLLYIYYSLKFGSNVVLNKYISLQI